MGSRSLHPVRVVLSLSILPILLSACSSPPPLPAWQYTGGPFAQNVSTLLVEGPDGALLTAGLATGEVFRSTDAGRTWRRSGSLRSRDPILTLIREPGGSAMFAGTRGGILRSTDEGATWLPLSADPAEGSTEVRSIAIDPLDPRYMFAGVTDRGIFRTTNGGVSWTRTTDTDTPSVGVVHDIRISPSNPNLAFASLSRRGVLRSSDRGASWSSLTPQLAASGSVMRTLALHPQSPDLLCFGTAAGDIYRSTDRGGRWTITRQGTRAVPVRSLVAPPGEPATILTSTEEGLLLSTDFGTSWQRMPSDLLRIPCVLVSGGSPGRPMLYALSPGVGLQRSGDGGRSWQPADRGLGGSTPGILVSGRRSGEMFCTVGPALFVHRPGSGAWVTASEGIHGGDITAVVFDLDGDSLMYAANDLGLYRSTTSGRSWEIMPRTFGPSPVRFFDTHQSIRTRMFLTQGEGIVVSTDRGATWKPSRPYGERVDVRSFTYAPSNSGFLHAATRDRGVFGSTDGGITWEPRRYGIREPGVAAVARDRDNPRLLFCWNERGEGYRSTDMGAEWTSWAPPWKSSDRVHLAVDREEPSRVIALVNGRQVFISETAGAVWSARIVQELDESVSTVFWNRSEGMLYAGTMDHGVFRVPLGAPGDESP